MQAIIHNGTNLVVFLRPDSDTLILDETGLRGAIRALDVTAGSHRLETVPDNPDFIGGVHGYDGAWFILDQERLDDVLGEQLTAAKATAIAAINAQRDALETAGFPHAGHRFQSDERSVARLSNSAQAAMAALLAGQNPAFPDWMTEDNQAFAVDAQGMVALQAALTLHAGALHQHGRWLKDQVTAAVSAAELAAIDIMAGWPE